MDDAMKSRQDYTYEYYDYPILEQCANYSLNGIIQFLQNEWNKIEIKSVQWDVERTELQAKIAYLQGERRSQENLKNDLIRRIKMLEYALKHERKKIDALSGKDTFESNESDSLMNNFANDDENLQSEFNDSDIYLELSKNNQKINDENIKWKDEKIRLKKLFLECSDNGDLKSNVENSLDAPEEEITDTESKKNKGNKKRPKSDQQKSSTSFIDGTFKFLSYENDFIKNDVEKSVKVEIPVYDSETEEALVEFDYLVRHIQQKKIPSPIKTNFGNEENEWAKVDQKAILKMKELYVQERGVASKTAISKLESQDGTIPIYDEVDSDMSDVDSDSSSTNLSVLSTRAGIKGSLKTTSNNNGVELGDLASLSDTNDTGLILAQTDNATVDLNMATTSNADHSTKISVSVIGGSSSSLLSSQSGVGSAILNAITSMSTETTGVVTSVNSTMTSVSSGSISKTDNLLKKSWTVRFWMRSHFDGVRAVMFHPSHPLVITASDDHTLKLWNLTKTIPSKKGSAVLDVEPIYSYRGHHSPVLCLCMDETNLYSGSLDGQVRIWKIPISPMDPYDAFDNTLHVPVSFFHSDAVWALSLHKSPVNGTPYLISASADGTVKCWCVQPGVLAEYTSVGRDDCNDGNNKCLERSHTFSSHSEGRPSCMVNVLAGGSICDESKSDNNWFVILGFTSGLAGIFDVDSGNFLIKFPTTAEAPNCSNPLSSTSVSVTCAASHPIKPTTVIGYDNGQVKCFDNQSADVLFAIASHLVSVSSIAIDLHGTFLLTGGHDMLLRVWNISNSSLLQEITCHRKKFDESVHCVAFHPTKSLFATAGADGLAKVFI